MILDTSAILALLREEPGHQHLFPVLERADTIRIGGPTLFEAAMVALRRFGEKGPGLVEHFLDEWRVQILPFGDRHWRTAFDAFVRFGKGRHPAALNYGDCMTYATARVAGMPLLFVGGDFARTDLEPA
ncbi:MAG TPA: type II toxin-antitoxin system VapC family toxin [Solirubrobacterales bacterium]|nr:type II toxin-antitoxin system VapC family toxin [Solirubrobacterales bacterium]